MLIAKGADNSIRWSDGERLDHLFERRCDQFDAEGKGDHLAVITPDLTLTFKQLDERANQVARHLLGLGLTAGDRIGVMFDKTPDTYIGLLAILKINAAYVPFDAGFPNDRIGFILDDADVKAIVSLDRFAEKLGDFSQQVIYLDADSDKIDAKDKARLGDDERPEANDLLAYIIYTSGTTGKPKGVTIEHPSICNFVNVAADVYGLSEDDRCYQGMTVAFDFSVEELWVPLIAGATLIPGRPSTSLVGTELAEYLLDNKVSYLCIVPTLLATIEMDLPDLKILLVSGEACPQNLVERWHNGTRVILNAYGPTEATVTCTLTELYPDKPVTIGGPLPTYTIVILEQDAAKEVPDGGTGEVAVAGIGLARDYLKRPDLTEEKFIPDFLDIPQNPSKRIYRTGDLGRINKDGEVEFLGRIDTQVKIRGHRIELTEIESVLMQLPQIAQAVVNTYEPEPGTTELVAYYSLKPGEKDVPRKDVSDIFRANLPPYMIPNYLEYLPVIPMTTSDKADRKALPPPMGARFIAETPYVAPSTKSEDLLAKAMGDIMKIERVSVEDNFFKDLGAHSLLMAQFGAKIRQLPGLPDVSMRDIYLNPTIAKLAAFVDSAATETPSAPMQLQRDALHVPSDKDYYLCGALQLAFYVAYGLFALAILAAGIKWSYAALDEPGALYSRLVAFGILSFALFTAIPIAAKWILIGRWKKTRIPIWSLSYFRFWLVKALVSSAPIAAFAGSPLYNVYLRLLGARIGCNTVIQSRIFSTCSDLVAIGDNTILRQDSMLPGYKAQSNYIYTGPISIGDNAFVGEASILDIDTVMENDTQLGHSSMLQEGARIPAGKHYHGSPAQETTTDYCTLGGKDCRELRRGLYTAFQLVSGFALFLPLSVVLLFWLFGVIRDYTGTSQLVGGQTIAGSEVPGLITLASATILPSLVVFFAVVALGLIVVVTIPRLFNRFLEPGKTYVLYGFHYYLHLLVAGISNSAFYNLLFGDSALIVQYQKWVGYDLNKVEQSGANFGLDQRHGNPFLCSIGTGTMVSDGLNMMNAQLSNTSFRLSPVKIGDHNYLGNNIHYPADAKVGANCLLATKVMVPIDGPMRKNVGLLGSPSFEIPRAAKRDSDISASNEPDDRGAAIARKTAHNIKTMAAYLLVNWFYAFVIFLVGFRAVLQYADQGFIVLVDFAGFASVFTILFFTLTERASLGFKDLVPRTVSMYDDYFWSHERHWKLTGTPLMPLFAGTPLKTLIARLLGVKLGKKVFDDGGSYYEKTLIEIGDYGNLNVACIFQGHSLEEGVFKSDRIKVGNAVTIGAGAFVHYGVTIGDNHCLDPDSFLMKGESPVANSIWQGNPANSIATLAPDKAADAETRSAPEPSKSKFEITPLGRPQDARRKAPREAPADQVH